MAKEKAKTPLQQTRGNFRAVGIVNRIGNDGAYKEGEIERGKSAGKEFRSLRFGIKTSETNELFVELFGMEKDAYILKTTTKEEREKLRKSGKKVPTQKLSFENRDDIPEGWTLIGVNVGTYEDDEAEKKKVVYETYVEYDAVDAIFETFEDGDSISVSGTVSLSEYENQQGEKVKQIRYQIGYASKLTKPLDFEDEKFVETASFDQEIVFVGSAYDKATNKLTVIGRTINYDGSWFDYPFIIDLSKSEVKDIATAFHKKLKFGDFVKVLGLCLNKTEEVEVEEKPAKVSSIFGDGGLAPKGQEKRANTKRVTELQITGVDLQSFVEKRYKIEDFVIEEELIEEEEEDTSNNPFASDSDDDDEEGEDELPFN
jgi:hypothetical protein